jgi:predicted transcriptional regulator
MTYKTGTIGEFMTWTKHVITSPAAADETPRRWFEDDATAKRALGATTSPEAMVKLLSEENLGLLRLIIVHKPASVRELATLAHRKESNLSRTLRKLHEAGIVDFEEGHGRTRAPRVTARRVTLELDFVGEGGRVSVEKPTVT